MRLFHLSEEPDIRLFRPRPSPQPYDGLTRDVVFAIAEPLLHNYLLPRDCPRVTFYAKADSHPADVAQLMGVTSARFVVAVEARWWPVIRSTTLYQYELPPASFRLLDAGAGYYVSEQAVEPLAVTAVTDLIGALLAGAVELRFMPDLRALAEAVRQSSLQYSLIRMRNAGQPISN